MSNSLLPDNHIISELRKSRGINKRKNSTSNNAKTPVKTSFEVISEGKPNKPAGIYFTPESGSAVRICGYLEVKAETQTEQGENYGRLLEWRDSKKRLHRWAMPAKFLHSSGTSLIEELASNGLEIAPIRRYYEKIAQYIASAETSKTFVSTDKLGLHENSFVLPDETFGKSDNEIIYQTEFSGHHNFKTAGTLDDWQKNISRYCVGNSRLLFSVSAAMASPLLPIVLMQGGGFHFRGATSTGKTTTLFVGGSVCGGDGEHGFSQTWKATANGLEVIAAGHNHNLLCLDEIGECDGREIGNVAYMLANGRGKTRMTKTIAARHSLSWNLLFLSTGEQKLADKITENGGTIKGGQEIRLCDIEADTGKFGLFENLHQFPSGQSFSDYLRSASCSYFGTPIRAFLKWLMEGDFDALRQMWGDFKEKFINSVLSDRSSITPEILRAAARFALVGFGGELATQAGVTQWSHTDAATASQQIFLQWLTGREGNGQSDIERGIRQVRKFIQSYEQSRFQKLWATDEDRINERVGYVRKNDNEEREFLIFPDNFKDICKGFDSKALARAMKDRGIVLADSEGKPTKAEKITARLSDKPGKAQRFYVVTEKIFIFDEDVEIKSSSFG